MERSSNEQYYERMFLENFIEFGALHRARVAFECLQRFKRFRPGNDTVRASLAVEILQTYLNAFEDIGIWVTVVPKWIRSDEGLVHLLAARATKAERLPRMRPKFSPREQLAFYGAYSPPENLARTLRLPYHDHEFESHGIPPAHREPLRSEMRELSRLSNAFFQEAQQTIPRPDSPGAQPSRDKNGAIYHDLAAWAMLNRLKHGLLVTMSSSTTSGPGVCIHTDPDDLGQYRELQLNYYYVRTLVALTFVGSLFLGRMLSLVYWWQYHVPPSVSWLHESYRVNLQRLDPFQMARVLRASRIPRRQDIIPPRSDHPRTIEPYLFAELSANWRRGHPE